MAEVSARTLSAHFVWSEPSGAPTGAALTRGTLTVLIENESVWGSPDFEWTWIELLEWLTANWLPLSVGDGLPFAAEPDNTEHLNQVATASVRDSSGNLAEERALTLWEFKETHDFARALPGTRTSPFIVWREGFVGHILTSDGHWTIPRWSNVQRFLSQIGDQIVQQLAKGQDQRSLVATASWAKREHAADEDIIEQATGMSFSEMPVVLRNWRSRNLGTTLSEAVARSEMLAAARMTAGLPDETITAVLEEIAAVPRGAFTAIEDLTRRTIPPLDQLDPFKPYEQGYWVAQRTRTALGLAPSDKFETDRWLTELGVECREVSLGISGIDAIAAWGDDHGPVVIINRDGRHSQSAVGRNASIAHEIGHLLLDRYAGLPAAEVLGGRSNPFIERRARAFAAELLLPNTVANAAFDSTRSREEVLKAARSLSRRYGVSQEIVAWQARNSDRPLDESVRRALATLVSAPQLY